MESQRAEIAREAESKGSARPCAAPSRTHGEASPDPFRQFGRLVGNRAAGRFLQAKLRVSEPGDEYEREADRVADEVVNSGATAQVNGRVGAPLAQRACHKCEEEEERGGARSDATLQRKAASVESALAGPARELRARQSASPQGAGEPLGASVRAYFEPKFNYDFGGVRVHTGAGAAQAARDVNALAYTVGSDVVFGEGQYAPESAAGRRLLAHELTHVVQQGAGELQGALLLQRQVPPPDAHPAPPEEHHYGGGLSYEMLAQLARQLNDAMDRLGTDEEAIYAALAGRTQEQIDGIASIYRAIYHRDLYEEIRSELNDSEMQHLALFAPTSAAGVAETPQDLSRRAATVARQLYAAMDQLGTDESAIYAALTGRTLDERRAIKDAYRELGHHHELEADLRDEMSGAELTRALRLLNQGMLEPEDELFLAMEGLGTDEATIFRVLDAMEGHNDRVQAVEASYRTKYHSDLVADLRGDLSGGDYAHAMRIVRPALSDTAFEDCDPEIIRQIRALVPTGIERVNNAISVLTRGWEHMTERERLKFNTYFDPHGAGFDQNFVADVLANFRKIRAQFNNNLTVECEADTGGICSGGRLYYTYGSNVHVCAPAFAHETSEVSEARGCEWVDWKQRDFVHELTHNALGALDRPYYLGNPAGYNAMTPRGNWGAQIPVIGQIVRAISRSDTLYAPDAYAFFAFRVYPSSPCEPGTP